MDQILSVTQAKFNRLNSGASKIEYKPVVLDALKYKTPMPSKPGDILIFAHVNENHNLCAMCIRQVLSEKDYVYTFNNLTVNAQIEYFKHLVNSDYEFIDSSVLNTYNKDFKSKHNQLWIYEKGAYHLTKFEDMGAAGIVLI